MGMTSLSTDQFDKLKGLLKDHGVPEAKLEERANLVLQKLGAPTIIAAFVGKSSWALRKTQASKPGIALRLVLPDELARHAEQTAIAMYGAGISNHKAKKNQDKGPPPVPQLDPASCSCSTSWSFPRIRWGRCPANQLCLSRSGSPWNSRSDW